MEVGKNQINMELATINGLPFVQFPQMKNFAGLVHAVTTRQGGISKSPFASLNLGLNTGDIAYNVLRNQRKLLKAFGWRPQSVVTPVQVHGNKVITVTQDYKNKGESCVNSDLFGVDGLVTKKKELMLMIKVADCFPVFFYDPEKQAIGLVHAGWRGVAGGIIKRGIKAMTESFSSKPQNIKVGIGPGIDKCCYIVGNNVREAFRKNRVSGHIWRTDENKNLYLDLKKTIFLELIGAGLRKENIWVTSECTSCNRVFFFSHRRDHGKTGRMAALIGLKG